MITRFGSRKFRWMFRLVSLSFASALFIASITPSWALTQSTDDPWAEPVNLSHSGVALNPAIVIDSEEVVHAVWREDLGNYVYAQFDGTQWSPPEMTDLDQVFRLPLEGEAASPLLAIYTGPNPLFIAGSGQYIFAFWISAEGKLLTSSVENQSFQEASAWNFGRPIAPSAVSFAVAVDARGEWHLAFIRTVGDADNPAGIYYARSKNSGRTWTVPVLLYESPYLRRLVAGEANLSIAIAGREAAPRVYVAWDNRPRKQVFLAQSADGGENWEQPVLIAGPEADSGMAEPFNIHVGANQNSVVLVWQSGRATNGLLPACRQIYQSSRDGGATWSDPQPLIQDLVGCVQSNQFVTGLVNNPEGLLYFLTESKGEIFLTAWNGMQWSQPRAQPLLTGFEEPEIYTDVVYGCHRTGLSAERLYVIGCDQGVGGDVWITSRDLGSNTSWFSSPAWSQPSPVTDENLELDAVKLVATPDGLFHAFFSKHQDRAIYYAYWDGKLWSRITPVLDLPEGAAASPAVAAGPRNELFLIAPNNRGALYFSRATSGSAGSESRWSKPTRLGTSGDGEIGSADVAWDAAGTIYVAYSVPVNEKRGIYLVQSKDQGTSWSEPLQVFNGTAAGFDLVGAPSMLISENGTLHIVWKQQSIQGDGVPQPLSLYYTRSEDGGQTFSDAKLVVEDPVAWREIVTDGKGQLHLLWQHPDTVTTVWDQVSLDGGISWQFPQGLPNEGRLAAVTKDPAGRLNLVGMGTGTFDLWLWDGGRWQSQEPLRWSLASQQESPVQLLASAVNKEGEMVVLLVVPAGTADVTGSRLLYSTHTLKLPPEETAPQGVPTPTRVPPTLVPATPTLELSLTPTAAVDNQPPTQDPVDYGETNNSIAPFTMTLIPVALLLLAVLGLVIRRATQTEEH